MPRYDSESILQEALLSCLITGTVVAQPKAWLVAAVCNASRNYWRQQGRFVEFPDALAGPTPDAPDAYVARLEQQILVRRLLSLLHPREREVLRLHYLEGLTAPELAVRLATTTGYAEQLLVKALIAARDLYERLHRAGDGTHGRRTPPQDRCAAVATVPIERQVDDGHGGDGGSSDAPSVRGVTETPPSLPIATHAAKRTAASDAPEPAAQDASFVRRRRA